jgi:hypothetical protein
VCGSLPASRVGWLPPAAPRRLPPAGPGSWLGWHASASASADSRQGRRAGRGRPPAGRPAAAAAAATSAGRRVRAHLLLRCARQALQQLLPRRHVLHQPHHELAVVPPCGGVAWAAHVTQHPAPLGSATPLQRGGPAPSRRRAGLQAHRASAKAPSSTPHPPTLGCQGAARPGTPAREAQRRRLPAPQALPHPCRQQ